MSINLYDSRHILDDHEDNLTIHEFFRFVNAKQLMIFFILIMDKYIR